MKYYELYNWDGIGQIVNGKEGIIEPIVQSIQKCFMTFPDQMITLYSFGFQQKNFNLLYRFYLALHGLRNFGDQLISDKAKDYLKKFYTFFSDFMANYLAKNIEDRKQGEELYNLLIKLNIGEELNRIDRSE